MTPFVLMIGLGIHATFEGLSLGLSTNFSSTAIFALAICLHKGAAGMSLGISMQRTFPGQDNFVIGMMTMFACFTPLGVIIGWCIAGSGNELLEILFSCLAAGTFIYIACSEIIVEEFSGGGKKYLKLLVYLIGITIITSLLFLNAGDDDDEKK